MLALVGGLIVAAPPRSLVVVESDERFDFGLFAEPRHGSSGPFPPAYVGIYEKPRPQEE